MAATVPPHLLATDLSRRFGQFWALRDATFSVPEGQITGLIGPNGAGKTTLFQCVAGVTPSTSGEVRLSGAAVGAEDRKHTLFFVPDGVRPWREQRVAWLLDFTRSVYGSSNSDMTRVVDALDISRLRAQRIASLSKGEHKRVMLAMALLSSRQLLLLDEPFDGLDLRQTRDAMTVLREECTRGRTLFLSIHQLTDAARVCDRFVLLSAGRVVGEGSLSELRTIAKVDAEQGALEDVFLALT